MSKEQLIKEFREKFGDRFTQVARYADKGWDEAYGKELARIEIDAEAFLLSAFDAGRASGIEEVKEHFQLRKDVLLNGGNALPFERSGNPQTMTEARAEGLRNAYNEILRFTPSSSKDN